MRSFKASVAVPILRYLQLNFERFKWGGVRHDQPLYIGLDLELLGTDMPSDPTEADRAMLRKILEIASSLPGRAKLSHLASAARKVRSIELKRTPDSDRDTRILRYPTRSIKARIC